MLTVLRLWLISFQLLMYLQGLLRLAEPMPGKHLRAEVRPQMRSAYSSPMIDCWALLCPAVAAALPPEERGRSTLISSFYRQMLFCMASSDLRMLYPLRDQKKKRRRKGKEGRGGGGGHVGDKIGEGGG